MRPKNQNMIKMQNDMNTAFFKNRSEQEAQKAKQRSEATKPRSADEQCKILKKVKAEKETKERKEAMDLVFSYIHNTHKKEFTITLDPLHSRGLGSVITNISHVVSELHKLGYKTKYEPYKSTKYKQRHERLFLFFGPIIRTYETFEVLEWGSPASLTISYCCNEKVEG